MDYRSTVVKLLDRSEAKGATDAEKAAFLAKVALIVAKHKIDDDGYTSLDTSEPIFKEFTFTNPHGHQKEYLFVRIMMALGCDCVKIKTDNKLIVYGFEEDIDRGDWLYGILIPRIMSTMAVMRSLDYKAADRNSYMIGYSDAVGSRLKASVNSVAGQDNSGKTAKLQSDRKAKVRALRDSRHSSLTLMKTSKTGSQREDGYAAGRSENLHDVHNLVSAGTTAITGG